MDKKEAIVYFRYLVVSCNIHDGKGNKGIQKNWIKKKPFEWRRNHLNKKKLDQKETIVYFRYLVVSCNSHDGKENKSRKPNSEVVCLYIIGDWSGIVRLQGKHQDVPDLHGENGIVYIWLTKPFPTICWRTWDKIDFFSRLRLNPIYSWFKISDRIKIYRLVN